MLEAEIAAGLGEGLRSVAGAVVGHDAGYPDAEAGVVGHRRLEEGDGAFFFLVGQDLREGDAGGVVDADMDELPTAAARAGIAGALAGNAMTDALETTELLDVDMDHLAGMLALVASDRLGRFDISQSRQSSTLENAADGGGRDADLMGDVLAGPTLPPQRHDALGDQRSTASAGRPCRPVALTPIRTKSRVTSQADRDARPASATLPPVRVRSRAWRKHRIYSLGRCVLGALSAPAVAGLWNQWHDPRYLKPPGLARAKLRFTQ